ncbi:MAG: 5-methyltetrahydropteroyltriglutamate--homocysteine S-methyltransferase, partial [Arthrobacter sp.]|nr:5-methyltetrahydropteroyltriglutamate--homocysteine S-methyltransferase [Arthrobacter sp.]
MTEQNRTTPFPSASILGYPRIGRRRELKKAVEAYWAGKIDAAALDAAAKEIQLGTARRLQGLGLTEAAAVPGTFSYYDQVLDAAAHLGAVPARFGNLLDAEGQLDIDGYFTLARGTTDQQPLEMTKWFDTNYHYLVPEIGPETAFALTSSRIVEEFEYALANGVQTRPYIVGPVTFLLLSKASDDAPAGFSPLSRLEDIQPVYAALLEKLAAAGAGWVQLDEPALVVDQDISAGEIQAAVARSYEVLSGVPNRPQLFVSTPYGALNGQLGTLAATGIDALHLDVFKGAVPSAAALAALGNKTLVAGVVDGHNIWRNDLAASADKIAALQKSVAKLAVSTSTTTAHVPHDVDEEVQLSEQLRSWLAFADQKAAEVVTLAGLLSNPEAVQPAIEKATRIIASRAGADGVQRAGVRARTAALTSTDFNRSEYGVREAAQQKALALPPLPTTTIGSFPQTSEIRTARARANKGELSTEQYEELMKEEIKRVVELQEELGFDVLVHG